MNVMRTALTGLAALLLGSGTAAPMVLQGQLSGEVPPSLSVGIWTVSPAGQPQQLLGSASAPQGHWQVTLSAPPAAAPTLQASSLNWPGLLPPVEVSGGGSGQELRAYAFSDSNHNGQPDPGEPLREVRLRDGDQPLFLVWVDRPVRVSGAHGYQTELQAGWNARQLVLGPSIQLRPYSGQPLNSRLSP
ncbi:hypothetical protein [Deinococcus sp. Marseille-Q6407]|uniref:hypothetical protein n=1 Tax=Deinococcus sp. Marseille-Q6407 TaxID=2969223 RepID=UPI0021C1EC03|nr:hypothetical protein [Deinococcus sp. Marseille-Q6407]